MKAPEWVKYKVGTPSKRENWTNTDCQPFTLVRHITHLKDAIRIIEDGSIRSSLVWDESRLRNTRTCVSWVSPNDWANGSIYGSISFEFDWEKIVESKNLYWVESMSNYHPPAYRILVTDKDKKSLKVDLDLYNPQVPDGPIYLENNTWYRNGNFTGEFLIDSDLFRRKCREIKFKKHHPGVCKTHGNSCSEQEWGMYRTGSMFLANLIGRQITKANKLFLEDKNKLTGDTECIISWLIDDLIDNIEEKNEYLANNNDNLLKSILRAFLIAYSEDNDEECELLNLFSKKKFKEIFKQLLHDFFGKNIEIEILEEKL